MTALDYRRGVVQQPPPRPEPDGRDLEIETLRFIVRDGCERIIVLRERVRTAEAAVRYAARVVGLLRGTMATFIGCAALMAGVGAWADLPALVAAGGGLGLGSLFGFWCCWRA